MDNGKNVCKKMFLLLFATSGCKWRFFGFLTGWKKEAIWRLCSIILLIAIIIYNL